MFIQSASGFYNSEVAKADNMRLATQVCRCICELPEILQKYFALCRLTGKECTREVNIEWANAQLRFAPGKKWTPIKCTQTNVLPKPARLVYMKARFLSFLSLKAIDEYIDGKGTMLIKLLDFFTLSKSAGPEMDRAELVTILAETMIIPAYALQHYISWEVVNDLCLKGTISYNHITASGLFYFDESGRPLRFETDDRYYTANDGSYHQYKWKACLDQQDGGCPMRFSATWQLPGGDHEYFKGEIAKKESTQFTTYQCTKAINNPRISHPKLAFP